MKVLINREQTARGVEASAHFGISQTNASHIMTILRDTLYTDRILAVLREYGSNAFDAHIEAGIPDVPIKITLPTVSDCTLRIRDFGPGLSEDGVLHVYTQYGDSTKRETDDQIGMMGIGGKSGFAYTDTFTVVSYHGGMKRIYLATLDASNLGLMQRMHEEPCGLETGLEIQIPVKGGDIWHFESKARKLFRHFNPQPEINTALPTNGRTEVDTGYIIDKPDPRGQWMAIMGCIPYRIDTHQIRARLEESNLWDLANHLSGGVFFRIGEVQISASREEIKYFEGSTKRNGDGESVEVPGTNDILFDKIATVLYEYLETQTEVFRQDNLTPWEKRLKGWALVGQWGDRTTLPIPGDVKKFCHRKITLWKGDEENPTPKTFTVLNIPTKESVHSIEMDPKLTLYYRDDPDKRLQDYRFTYEQRKSSYIIRPYKGDNEKAIRAELDAVLARAHLTGVPIVNLSTIDWVQPPKHEIEKNIKHRVSSFKLVGTATFGALSKNWATVARVPTDNDVFEVISYFDATGEFNIFTAYKEDKELAQIFGFQLPPIYGYKTTTRKPLKPKDCKGTQYRVWRQTFFRHLLKNPDNRKSLGQYRWAMVFGRLDWMWKWFQGDDSKRAAFYRTLEEELGLDHPITRVFTMQRNSQIELDKMAQKTADKRRYVKEGLPILDRLSRTKRGVAADWALKAINATYPLLEVGGEGILSFCGMDAKHWFDYVHIIDNAKLAPPLKGA